MKRDKYRLNLNDDTTKYGEFVCSCYKWLPLDEQKAKAKYLEEITHNSNQ